MEDNQQKHKPWFRKAGRITVISLKWLCICGLFFFLLAGGVAFGYVSALVKDDPVRSKDEIMKQVEQNVVTGSAFFNDNTLIGQLRTEEDRSLVTMEEIPQVIFDAVFAVEDKNFYEHNGIDYNGLFRAFYQKLTNKEVQTGGSTITQQLARRVFLSLDKEDSRKAKEILLSLRMERLMTKDQILLAYLIKIPYGNGNTGTNVYGIKAAAKGIFGITDLKDVNLAQAAYLAGIPQLPSSYSAFTGTGQFNEEVFKRAVNRQQLVLKRMLQENKINEQQYQEALAFDLKSALAKPDKNTAYQDYPYLMMEVERETAIQLLKQKYPDLDRNKDKDKYDEALKEMRKQVLQGGYQIYTTIDKTIYDSMQAIAKNDKNFSQKDKRGLEQTAAVMMDSKTSAVLGMIEGRSFEVNQINMATQDPRQPGSTLKPIAAFIPAMEKGLMQPAGVLDDSPIIMKNGNSLHIPVNAGRGYQGLVTARKALNQSYNIPALRLYNDVIGIEEAWSYAKKMGISTIKDQDYNSRVGVIGGMWAGTTVKDMTNAYATMANKGNFNEAFMISKITDSQGNVVYEHETKPVSVFSEETAYLITDMLKTVLSNGTGTQIKSSFSGYGKMDVVGKTGSTQDDTDAWFVGYTPSVTLGVWAGYEERKYTLQTKAARNRAMSIWSLVMNDTLKQKPDLFADKKFTKPDNIVTATVSNVSGLLPNDLTRQSNHLVTDIFNKKFLPKKVDDRLTRVRIISYNNINYIAQSSTPEDFVQSKIVVKRDKSLSQLMKEIQNALPKVPAKKRHALSFYKPKDYNDDAPTEIDPRKDDGVAPAAPGSLVATRSGGVSTITFGPSSSQDVIGYRLYRSVNRGPFQRVGGKVVLVGKELKFTDEVSMGANYAYYVTAVDVAGNESVPSSSFASGGTPTPTPDPPVPGGEGTPSQIPVPDPAPQE